MHLNRESPRRFHLERHRLSFRLLLGTASLFAAGAVIQAQQAPSQGNAGDFRLSVETDLVVLHATVTNQAGRPVADLQAGEEATVAVAVRGVTVKPMRDRRRKRVEARVFDDSGPMVAVWFNQPWIARQLGEGAGVVLHGKLRRRGEFWVSEHETFGDGLSVRSVGLVPVHPATEGISAAKLRELGIDDGVVRLRTIGGVHGVCSSKR